MFIDLLCPLCSCFNLAIMPFGNDPLLPQKAQMRFQLFAQPLISVGIGVEDGDLIGDCLLRDNRRRFNMLVISATIALP